MADTTLPPASRFRIDRAWLAILAIPALLAIFAPEELWPALHFAGSAIARTGVFIIFAILAVAFLKATGAENLLARAFEGHETRMIVLAAFAGGLAPFCSCEVIPFIAALLAVGAPLSAVMAFWLSSPLMDPAMFFITSGELGLGFALAKMLAAFGIALTGGFTVKALSQTALFSDPLKKAAVESLGGGHSAGHDHSCHDHPGHDHSGHDHAGHTHAVGSCCSATGCSCSGDDPFSGEVVWKFWPDPARRTIFRDTAMANILFLGKWLLLAYLIEALMIRYIPAELVSGWLGGTGIVPIVLASLVGAPAYLNGYAAVPMVSGLLEQGMGQGPAMSFVIAGGVSCIPAAVAVWAMVKPRVFAAYLGFAVAGSVVAGLSWGLLAG